jgi:hypothetical protein
MTFIFHKFTLWVFPKVTHFEIACKAYEGVAKVTLFRLFYRLKADGDWNFLLLHLCLQHLVL